MSTALWSAGAAGGKATKKSLALVNIDLQGSNAKDSQGAKWRQLAGAAERLSMCTAEEHSRHLNPPPATIRR